MAQIPNPRKEYQFSITIAGLNPFLAQEVDLPEESIEVVDHGDTNHDIKTGGRKKIGKIIISKISTALGPDNWVYDWMQEVQDQDVGGGLIPDLYKRTVIIDQFSNDGITVINSWEAVGCWPSKRDAIQLKRMSSNNTMEKIELEVDKLRKS